MAIPETRHHTKQDFIVGTICQSDVALDGGDLPFAICHTSYTAPHSTFFCNPFRPPHSCLLLLLQALLLKTRDGAPAVQNNPKLSLASRGSCFRFCTSQACHACHNTSDRSSREPYPPLVTSAEACRRQRTSQKERGPLVRVRLKAGGPFTYEGFVLILPQERTKQIGRSMAAPGLKRSRYVAPTTLKVKSMAAASWTAPLSRRLPPNIICCQTIKEQRLRTSSLPILGLRLSSWGQCAAATSRSG